MAQTATGTMLSTHNGIVAVADSFSYPLNIDLTILNPDGDSCALFSSHTAILTNVPFGVVSALFDHSYNRILQPSPLTLGSTIKERQLASA